MSFLDNIAKTISKSLTDWENDPARFCENCKDKSILQKEIFYCDTCSRELCDKCNIEPYYLYKKYTCSKCDKQNRKKFKDVIIVKSEHIGGHKIIQKLSLIKSDMINTNYDIPTDNLKYKALKLGANGILGFRREKDTHATGTDSKDGLYLYSMFGCSGVPVIVEKNKRQ